MDKNKVIESASKLIAKGQFDKAIKEYQRVLEVDPDDVRVLQKLAELYQKMQRRDEAADCFEKVAKTYAAQGFYLKAVALYKQVLKVVDRIEVNVRLAELYQQLGLVGDATKEWQSVAAFYEKTGDLKSSLDTLKKLVDLDPDNVAARIRLGEQYARQDNVVEAVAELRRAAQYLQRNGRQDDYLRVAERISHLDQGDVTLAKELAESYLSKGDSKRALAKLQICFKANPRDLGTLQMLARAFQELGQVSKTVSVLKELARVHLDSKKSDDARKVYKQAQELAPDDAELKNSIRVLEEAAAQPARPPTEPIARPSTVPIPSPARPPTGPIATAPLTPSPARGSPPLASPARGTPPVHGRAAIVTPAASATVGSASGSPPTAPHPAPPRGPPDAGPVSVAKLLKETEVYVKYGLSEKALEHLRKIFALEPDNLEAHEKARALAVATNRPADVLVSLGTLARLYTARSDPRAEATREELRSLDPGNAALGAAGSPASEEPVEVDESDSTSVEMAPPPPAGAPEAAEVDVDAMEVEEVEEVAAPSDEDDLVETGEVIDEGEVIEGDHLDDGAIVEEPEAVFDDAPPEPAAQPALAAESVGAGTDPAGEAVEAAPAAPVEEDAFASDLAEAEFYLQAGLPEDARGIIEAILMAEPDHPEAGRRLAEMDGRPPPAPMAPAPVPPPPSFADDDERTMLDARPVSAQTSSTEGRDDDLAAELAAELASEVAGMAEGTQPDKALDADVLDPFQVPAHQVLGEFRAKVQEVVRPEDAQTHYDLGIAYKEMGLLDEAIAEFDLALRHGSGVRKVDCISMLGVCAMDKGRPEEAVQVFQRGLAEPDLPSAAKRALGFDLAIAYEAIGESALALEQYKNVERAERGFRDVASRIVRLGGTISAPVNTRPPPARRASAQTTPAAPGAPAAAPPVAASKAPMSHAAAPASSALGGAGSLAARPPGATLAPSHEDADAPAASDAGTPAAPEPPPADSAARRNRKIGFV